MQVFPTLIAAHSSRRIHHPEDEQHQIRQKETIRHRAIRRQIPWRTKSRRTWSTSCAPMMSHDFFLSKNKVGPAPSNRVWISLQPGSTGCNKVLRSDKPPRKISSKANGVM